VEFYGRIPERKKLTKALTAEGCRLSLIYGRRRVGKSELIKQVLREIPCKSIYYECKQTTQINNTDSLAVLIGEALGFPRPAFSGIEELLTFLFRQAQHQNLILVLDEYPYLRETVKGLDSILQSLIDTCREQSGLKLVLCGSYVDTMKSLLLRENPLFGRVDLTIDLKPMDYYDSALFYPGFSAEDRVRLYSVFGGIPYYNRLIDPQLSVRENIIELISSPGARLENEVVMYLKSEIARITNANEVFETLARGFSRFSDILNQSHVSSGPTLVDVLDKLIRMEVVKKESPINDENNKRKTGYYITDNLSLFYYRYIFRYLSQMNIMDPDAFFDRYIASDFEAGYVPRIFESICRQYLIRRNRSGLIEPPFFRIGKYYYDDPVQKTNGEFDVVTEDETGFVFYEAKFRKEPLTAGMIREEIRQVRSCGLTCSRYGFFSRSGFACDADSGQIFYTLQDLYM